MDMDKWKEVILRNFEEHDAFCRLLDKKSEDSPGIMEPTPDTSPPLPLAKLMDILDKVKGKSIRAGESIFYLRGLITEMGNLLDYLKLPDSKLTDEILNSTIQGSSMIKTTFDITKEFDGEDFDLHESGIPYFLDLLTCFAFGGEGTADEEGDRMELVGVILGELREGTLGPIVLCHLMSQTKALFNKFCIGLKNVKKENVVHFNIINSTFSCLNLMEIFMEELEEIQDEDVKSLNSLVRVADSAFPGFPLLGVVTGKIAETGMDILKKEKGNGPMELEIVQVQEESLLNVNELLPTLLPN